MSVTNPSPLGLVRSFASLSLLVLILVTSAGNWLFPRQPTVDPKAFANLETVTEQLKRVADNMENTAQTTTQMVDRLGEQWDVRQGQDNKTYENLLKQYGYDVDLSVAPQPNGGLYPATDHIRSEHLPPGAGGSGQAEHLQSPSQSQPGAANSGLTPVDRFKPRVATQQPG